MPSFGFIGPCYQSRSINADVERSINLFPEIIESNKLAGREDRWVLYYTPGRQIFCVLAGPPTCVVSANLGFVSSFDTQPVYFAIGGDTLYGIAVHFDGVTFSGVPIVLGTVASQALSNGQLLPSQIIVLNPLLLFVVAAGKAFVAAYGTPITSSVLNYGGSAYNVGDTGIILGSNGLDAQYVINTVDNTAGVLQSAILTGGKSYVEGDVVTASTTGAGCTMTVDAVDGNGGVVAFHQTAPGSGYVVGVSAVTGGAGTGFTITIIKVALGVVLTYSLSPSTGSGYSTGTNVGTLQGGPQPGTSDGLFTVDITGVGAAAWKVEQQIIPAGTLITDNYIQSCTYMDGYTIVSLGQNEADPERRQFFISRLNDPSYWSPLDVGEKEGASDPIIAVFAAYEMLLLFGQKTMEIWYNNPNGPAFPFQRVQGGGLIECGLVGPFFVAKAQYTVVWLGIDDRGTMVAYMLRGMTPVRISNHAVEYRWRNYDATGGNCYTYQENGHEFVCFQFPIPDHTWVADLTTLGPDGKPCWHERLGWDGSQYHADHSRFHAYSFPIAHVTGDYDQPLLYIQSVDIPNDNCANIRRLRISPPIFSEEMRFITNSLRLYMETGTYPATGPGSTPHVSMRFSNDGGHTWSQYYTLSAGLIGQYRFLITWLRLGMSRNRVYEISSDDPIPNGAWIDAYHETVPTVTRF